MMKKIILLLAALNLLSSQPSFAIGRIQNEDVKSLSDIESSVLSTTGNLTLSSACISSPGSTTGLATGQFVYDSTNPTYISSGTTIAGLPGTCSAGQIQMSTAATHAATGDTLTFGGQPSQLINITKLWDANTSQQLSADLSNISNAVYSNQANTYTAGPQSLGTQTLSLSLTNSSSGTTANELVILNSSGQALTALTTSTNGVVGIAVSGAGTSGTVQVSQVGIASCVFDGATTAGDYVQASVTAAGDCHDAGSTFPTSGNQVLGRVTTTNGSAGTYPVLLSLGGGSGGSSSGSKNYLTAYTASTSSGVPNTGNGNFESGSTTGWSLGTIGTLTNGLPTGTPTFGSGASGNLSISVVSGGSQISGLYSLSYASTAATTAGNMVASQSFYIDTEDQAKVMTVKFYYKVNSGAANDNFSGSSSNSFAWAAYDVTNSAWLGGAGNFCMTQNSGTGYCTGTFQTAATTQQIRFVLYNANASSGATTVYFDDFFVGPQTAPFGPAMTDPVAYTPVFTGLGTVTGTTAYWLRRGSNLYVYGYATTGTVTASTVSISLPSSLTVSSSLTGSGYQIVGSLIGNVVGANSWSVLAQPSSTVFNIGLANSGSNPQVAAAGNGAFGSTEPFSWFAEVPIAGWSSNSSMSSDTDTRVVAALYQTTGGVTSWGASQVIPYTSKVFDTHSAYNTSTGLYTCPVTGIYRVTNQFYGTTNFTYDYLGKNGSTILSRLVQNNSSGQSASIIVQCNAGDTLGIYNAAASTVSVDGSSFNSVSFERLSGPAVVAATESVNAAYQNTAGTTVGTSATTIPFATKYYDSHNAWNNANANAYTAPVSGKYRISATLSLAGTNLSTSQLFSLQVVQAGSASVSKYLQQIYGNGTSAAYMVTGSTTFNLLAGDTLTIQAASSVSGTLNTGQGTNHFAIERVGN